MKPGSAPQRVPQAQIGWYEFTMLLAEVLIEIHFGFEFDSSPTSVLANRVRDLCVDIMILRETGNSDMLLSVRTSLMLVLRIPRDAFAKESVFASDMDMCDMYDVPSLYRHVVGMNNPGTRALEIAMKRAYTTRLQKIARTFLLCA